MKNDKPTYFSVYHSVFFRFSFFNFSKIDFFYYNWSIFSEPNKLEQTNFIDFHNNRAVFIDI
jgi:hypothetical protein